MTSAASASVWASVQQREHGLVDGPPGRPGSRPATAGPGSPWRGRGCRAPTASPIGIEQVAVLRIHRLVVRDARAASTNSSKNHVVWARMPFGRTGVVHGLHGRVSVGNIRHHRLPWRRARARYWLEQGGLVRRMIGGGRQQCRGHAGSQGRLEGRRRADGNRPESDPDDRPVRPAERAGEGDASRRPMPTPGGPCDAPPQARTQRPRPEGRGLEENRCQGRRHRYHGGAESSIRQ